MSTVSDPAFERSLYVANLFGGILFGLQVYMCFHSCYLLHASTIQKRLRNFYIAYSLIMLTLSVFSWMGNALMGQLMWIDHRNYPGGPLAYYYAKSTVWFSIFGTATSMVQDFMNDALLLYRCYIIWNANRWVIAFPVLMFVASTAMAIIALVQSALPNANFFQKAATSFAIPWLSLTCGLNLLVTALIAGRLLFVGYKFSRLVSDPKALQVYTGIVAILVESALPMSILGVLFAIFLGKNFPSEISLAIVWGAFVALAPQLIILRVAMGRAWTKTTATQITSSPIAFAKNQTNGGMSNKMVKLNINRSSISRGRTDDSENTMTATMYSV